MAQARRNRAIPGHWEGDLLGGARNSHVATLVERHSRFCLLVKVSGKDTSTLVAALSQQVRQLPAALRRSLTWDRGLEMAQHKSFTMATDVKVYFCDPQSPWQRGSNENTNGLLRQYLPKKTDLSCYSQSDLDEIALRLNQRPRKTLGFQTPADRLQASVDPLRSPGFFRTWALIEARNSRWETCLTRPAALLGRPKRGTESDETKRAMPERNKSRTGSFRDAYAMEPVLHSHPDVKPVTTSPFNTRFFTLELRIACLGLISKECF